MPRTTTLITALATVIAGLALATSTAAATPVEVVNEATAEHCSIPAANCEFTVEGDWHLQDAAMNTLSACHLVTRVRLAEDGSGIVTSVNFEPASGCHDVNCTVPEGNWTIQTMEEIGANEYGTELRICLQGSFGHEFHCDAPLHVEEDPSQEHHYLLGPASSHHGPISYESLCTPLFVFVALDNMEIVRNNIEILHY